MRSVYLKQKLNKCFEGFLLCGIMTLLQVNGGMVFPMGGRASRLWSGIFFLFCRNNKHQEENLPFLRRNLECALLICGIYVMLLVCTGLIDKIGRYFTATINGIVIISDNIAKISAVL